MSGVISTAFRSVYTLAFQVSPIIFSGGLFASTPGMLMPIVGVLGGLAGFAQGAASSGSLSISDFPWQFVPLAGATPINNTAATYSFANQRVAGNAIVKQPNVLSLRMIMPVKDTGGFITKLPIFTSMLSTIEQHIDAGGTFTVAMPSYISTDCLLLRITDITAGTMQQQIEWQWDFERPLISLQSAQTAMNGLMSKISGGQQITSSAWSGGQAAAGSPLQGALGSLQTGVGSLIGAVGQYL